MGTAAKEETDRLVQFDGPPLMKAPPPLPGVVSVIDLSSSGSDSEAETDKRPRASDDDDGVGSKKRKSEGRVMANLPPGFLDPLPASGEKAMRPSPVPLPEPAAPNFSVLNRGSRQFWKAGDFEGLPVVHESAKFSSGMDHVRVHPKFLHSNATSHKWALGAFAELLDNSLDEACNGATFVNIDVLKYKKDGSRMLLIEDNGGGMNPDKMRQCMSLGYSRKSQIANCIGQYGNGFKTSTMRLGADVIVFSCSCGEGNSPTKSIGMLSYTFLRSTGKEDIVVPMLDYEKRAHTWEKMTSSAIDWKMNVDIFVKWSPYSSEFELLQQLDLIPDHGTRIVIYNLWEDDTGKMELDFDTDKHDIHLSGVNRDEKKIQMAKQFPNSKHFLTYRHSLRSYASILYLRLPNAFKMVLRGVEIEPHNIVNDMMLKQEVTYRPNHGIDKVPKDPNLVAVVTIGFVKDAKHHIDVQGFNVYHKNRLIKPFWRVWNAAGSDGRGVIGVLEANFVEPAHDKQGFERTTVLSRLESRLIQMQKTYWATNCHKVGYAPRCNRRRYAESEDNESSDEAPLYCHTKKRAFSSKISKETSKFQYQNKLAANVIKKDDTVSSTEVAKSRTAALAKENGTKSIEKLVKIKESYRLGAHGLPYERSASDSVSENICNNGDSSLSLIPDVSPARNASGKETNCSELLATSSCSLKNGDIGVDDTATRLQSKAASLMFKEVIPVPEVDQSKIKQLEDENDVLKQSLKTIQESMLFELQQERNRNKTLVDQLEQKEKKLEEANKEQEALIDIFSEERIRRDEEEATLRRRLKDAQDEISDLLEKLATCAKR